MLKLIASIHKNEFTVLELLRKAQSHSLKSVPSNDQKGKSYFCDQWNYSKRIETLAGYRLISNFDKQEEER